MKAIDLNNSIPGWMYKYEVYAYLLGITSSTYICNHENLIKLFPGFLNKIL